MNVVHPPSRKGPDSNIFKTDAVEVYVDGTFSERHARGDRTLDAATMPVLQYVGVPGEVPAYGDPGAPTLRCSIARPGNGARG